LCLPPQSRAAWMRANQGSRWGDSHQLPRYPTPRKMMRPEMSTPGFHAESSLGPALGTYRGNAGFGGSGAGAILPMQGFSASSALDRGALSGFQGLLWPIIRCCKYSKFAGAVVCTQRRHSPLEQCRCESTLCPPGVPNCPDLPVIKCNPPVATF